MVRSPVGKNSSTGMPGVSLRPLSLASSTAGIPTRAV